MFVFIFLPILINSISPQSNTKEAQLLTSQNSTLPLPWAPLRKKDKIFLTKFPTKEFQQLSLEEKFKKIKSFKYKQINPSSFKPLQQAYIQENLLSGLLEKTIKHLFQTEYSPERLEEALDCFEIINRLFDEYSTLWLIKHYRRIFNDQKLFNSQWFVEIISRHYHKLYLQQQTKSHLESIEEQNSWNIENHPVYFCINHCISYTHQLDIKTQQDVIQRMLEKYSGDPLLQTVIYSIVSKQSGLSPYPSHIQIQLYSLLEKSEQTKLSLLYINQQEFEQLSIEKKFKRIQDLCFIKPNLSSLSQKEKLQIQANLITLIQKIFLHLCTLDISEGLAQEAVTHLQLIDSLLDQEFQEYLIKQYIHLFDKRFFNPHWFLKLITRHYSNLFTIKQHQLIYSEEPEETIQHWRLLHHPLTVSINFCLLAQNFLIPSDIDIILKRSSKHYRNDPLRSEILYLTICDSTLLKKITHRNFISSLFRVADSNQNELALQTLEEQQKLKYNQNLQQLIDIVQNEQLSTQADYRWSPIPDDYHQSNTSSLLLLLAHASLANNLQIRKINLFESQEQQEGLSDKKNDLSENLSHKLTPEEIFFKEAQKLGLPYNAHNSCMNDMSVAHSKEERNAFIEKTLTLYSVLAQKNHLYYNTSFGLSSRLNTPWHMNSYLFRLHDNSLNRYRFSYPDTIEIHFKKEQDSSDNKETLVKKILNEMNQNINKFWNPTDSPPYTGFFEQIPTDTPFKRVPDEGFLYCNTPVHQAFCAFIACLHEDSNELSFQNESQIEEYAKLACHFFATSLASFYQKNFHQCKELIIKREFKTLKKGIKQILYFINKEGLKHDVENWSPSQQQTNFEKIYNHPLTQEEVQLVQLNDNYSQEKGLTHIGLFNGSFPAPQLIESYLSIVSYSILMAHNQFDALVQKEEIFPPPPLHISDVNHMMESAYSS